LGEPRVNVLEVNVALDDTMGTKKAELTPSESAAVAH